MIRAGRVNALRTEGRTMKFVQTVVSSQGFRDQASNPDRLALLADLTRLCAREGGRLLLIPAGFLTAGSEEGVHALVEQVRRVAEAAGVAVIGGVDVDGAASKGSLTMEKAVQEGRLGYFGFATGSGVTPADGALWRQTSITSAHADLVPDDAVPGAGRVVKIGRIRVAVLICGELFSWRARCGVSHIKAKLIVDIGHSGMGMGLIPAMLSVANESRCPVAHSQHLRHYRGGLHFIDSQGKQHSGAVDEAPVIHHGALWAAWAVRTV